MIIDSTDTSDHIWLLGKHYQYHIWFILNIYIDFHVTDDCIYRLSSAWPKLKKFHIAHLNTSPRPLTTLIALQSFAIHNPQLTYLRIRLDAHPVTPADSKAQRLDHIRIHFDYSPLSRDSTRQVAEYICDLYPCAELIISGGGRRDTFAFDHSVWGEVHNLIPIISSIRYRAPMSEVCGMHDINNFLTLTLHSTVAALAEDYDAERRWLPHPRRVAAKASICAMSKLVHLLPVIFTIRFQGRIPKSTMSWSCTTGYSSVSLHAKQMQNWLIPPTAWIICYVMYPSVIYHFTLPRLPFVALGILWGSEALFSWYTCLIFHTVATLKCNPCHRLWPIHILPQKR